MDDRKPVKRSLSSRLFGKKQSDKNKVDKKKATEANKEGAEVVVQEFKRKLQKVKTEEFLTWSLTDAEVSTAFLHAADKFQLGENAAFLKDYYGKKSIKDLYEKYIKEDAPKYLNIDAEERNPLKEHAKKKYA